MMYFRRLYWVIERQDISKETRVMGVYTSIPDLVDRGLDAFKKKCPESSLRLSLVKLDSQECPLGEWVAPHFNGMEEGLLPYVASGEFADGECKELVALLRQSF